MCVVFVGVACPSTGSDKRTFEGVPGRPQAPLVMIAACMLSGAVLMWLPYMSEVSGWPLWV